MTVPDFRRAKYNLCTENPFRLTPPAAQANLNVKSNGDNANAASAASEHSTQHKSTQQNYPDPSFSDIFSAFSEAFTQRKAQGLAFLELTNSELMLIKKSFFVTVFACLAAFAVGTVCWLILNIAIGAILHSVGVSYVSHSHISIRSTEPYNTAKRLSFRSSIAKRPSLRARGRTSFR